LPTYQYRCTECGHEFEEFQSFTDDALSVCPVCAGRLRKVFNAVGVVFKGSGFYRNDSRSSAKAEASSDGSTSSPTSTKDAPAATSAPATAGSDSSSSGGSSSGAPTPSKASSTSGKPTATT
jgi:putative FmdB family regulatory protein